MEHLFKRIAAIVLKQTKSELEKFNLVQTKSRRGLTPHTRKASILFHQEHGKHVVNKELNWKSFLHHSYIFFYM